MAGVASPETARNQGSVDSGWPWTPVALGWRRAACSHTPLAHCGCSVPWDCTSHTTSFSCLLSESSIFPISIRRNVHTEKPPSAGSFCRRKIDLVGFLPCNSDTLWHIIPHIVAWHIPSATGCHSGPLHWAAPVLSLMGEVLHLCCCNDTYHVLLDRCLSSIKLPLKWRLFCSGCDQRLLVGCLK